MIFKYNMTTIKDLIFEKLKNFENFVILKFPNNELIKKQIQDMNKLPIEAFVLYIKNHVKIHENNIDHFFNKLFVDYNINPKEVLDEDIIKFKKYFHFFITIIDEIEKL